MSHEPVTINNQLIHEFFDYLSYVLGIQETNKLRLENRAKCQDGNQPNDLSAPKWATISAYDGCERVRRTHSNIVIKSSRLIGFHALPHLIWMQDLREMSQSTPKA